MIKFKAKSHDDVIEAVSTYIHESIKRLVGMHGRDFRDDHEPLIVILAVWDLRLVSRSLGLTPMLAFNAVQIHGVPLIQDYRLSVGEMEMRLIWREEFKPE